MVELGDDRNLGSNVTVGISCYCGRLVVLTSRLDFLIDPLLLPMLRSDEVLIANSFLFVRLTVMSLALIVKPLRDLRAEADDWLPCWTGTSS